MLSLLTSNDHQGVIWFPRQSSDSSRLLLLLVYMLMLPSGRWLNWVLLIRPRMLRSGQVKEKETSLIPTVPEVVGISVPSSQAKKHVVAYRLKGPLVADKTIDPSSSRETVVSCFSYKYLSLYIYSSFLWLLCRGARQVYTIVDGILDHFPDFGLISVEPSMSILFYLICIPDLSSPRGNINLCTPR